MGWHVMSTPASAAQNSAVFGRALAHAANFSASLAPAPAKRRARSAHSPPKRIAAVKNSTITTPHPGQRSPGTPSGRSISKSISMPGTSRSFIVPSPRLPMISRAIGFTRSTAYRWSTRPVVSSMRGWRSSIMPPDTSGWKSSASQSSTRTFMRTVLGVSDFATCTRPDGSRLMPP